MTITEATTQTTTTELRPGDRYQRFHPDHGFLLASGVVAEIDGDMVVGTLDGRDGYWQVPLEGCAPAVEIVPLDPSITDPFSIDLGWRSAAALRLRTAYEELAGFEESGVPPKTPERSREARMQQELLMAQERADNAALAALVPITPCPAWCTEDGSHAWECGDPGSYTRDHFSAPSEKYGDGMKLVWLEGNEWPGTKPHVMVDKPALDYCDDGVSVDNVPTFIAELQRLAALAGSCREADTIAGVILGEMNAKGMTTAELSAASNVPLKRLTRLLDGTETFYTNELGDVGAAIGKSMSAIVAAAKSLT